MDKNLIVKKPERPDEQPNMQYNLQDIKLEQAKRKEPMEEKLKSENLIAKEETVPQLKNQLEALMNSLAVLSIEKSKMEANFQSEKKQIRTEREEYERVIKNLKEKLKYCQCNAASELENCKYKLIMEQHEREKQELEFSAIIEELQTIIRTEKNTREQLELQLQETKNTFSNKSYNRILEVELDVLKNKLRQAETNANETSSHLLNLQSEMSIIKRKHRNAILEEKKRASTVEREARVLVAAHESRVADLEARLAELSGTIGGYDRLRQHDQEAIHKLKDELITLESKMIWDTNENPQQLSEKIRNLYFQLLKSDKENSYSNVKDLLNCLKLCDKNQDLFFKEKYEKVLKEFQEFKQCFILNNKHNIKNKITNLNNERQSIQSISNNKNWEEKYYILVSEITEKERDFKIKLAKEKQLLQEQNLKEELILAQKDSEYLNKVAILEQQLLRQRERSLAVIQEKDNEIQILKSSFHALLPQKNIMLESKSNIPNPTLFTRQNYVNTETNDFICGLLTVENNSPILHYTQELARKEVEISSLRNEHMQLEATCRELERKSFSLMEKHKQEIETLSLQIKRLEACKSREGANLEYLKNVFINYLTNNDSARKHHMLNAISTVLRFTPDENKKICTNKS